MASGKPGCNLVNMAKKDICSREDIEMLVKVFYDQLLVDKVIGHFFTEVVVLDLNHHLPVIVDFWEGILFDNPVYKGNPMIKHISMHKKSKIDHFHFITWLEIWEKTINSLFDGELSKKAIERAKSIASLMEYKVNQSDKP